LGVMKSINDPLDVETAELVADEFGYKVENTAVSVEDLLQEGRVVEQTDGGSLLLPRPPVVTVMGHVDHGKTSLLDVIRETNVVKGEAGGITQHIGAYMVPTAQGPVCFLDTPGHAAFTEMRARGASITDIVILVVAADDGVMPQTLEAVNHAKAAEIPVVVAVNKMDKPDANPDRVKQQLSEYGLQPEDWGGDTQFVPVSAIKKEGIDDLLESVAVLAQILELKAPIDCPAHGTVIEARLDKGRGPVGTVLIQRGQLRRGQHFVIGETTGRVRAMTDHSGKQVNEAGPSHAVEIIGLDAVPQAGDAFDVVEGASRAEQVAERRREGGRKHQQAATVRMSLEDLQAQVAAGDVGELKVIVKADVHGSAEALKQSLEKLSTSEVKLDVIHLAVGAINESDVQLAMASNAVVIGFHVRPEGKARSLAERESVDMRLHTIIYEAIDEMKAALEGLLAPDFKEASEGRAEIRDTFSVPGGVTIAGCYVTEGKVRRASQCRLLRDNVVIHTGTVGSLRRFKDDVKEVLTGFECGIGLEKYNDLKPGDVIECFRMDEVKRTLDDVASRASAGAPA
ncbi:MAG: translation initiation factor IF-2, partial [Myxococcales bacterium]